MQLSEPTSPRRVDASATAVSPAPDDKTEEYVTLAVPEHAPAAIPALYRVEDVMPVLRMGRSTIYELIRTGRLRTVKEGRARFIPATAINEYVEAASWLLPIPPSPDRTWDSTTPPPPARAWRIASRAEARD